MIRQAAGNFMQVPRGGGGGGGGVYFYKEGPIFPSKYGGPIIIYVTPGYLRSGDVTVATQIIKTNCCLLPVGKA